jgi:hypothetical protein
MTEIPFTLKGATATDLASIRALLDAEPAATPVTPLEALTVAADEFLVLRAKRPISAEEAQRIKRQIPPAIGSRVLIITTDFDVAVVKS